MKTQACLQTQDDVMLEVRDLWVSVRGSNGPVPVLRGVSMDLGRGRTRVLTGASGCGKTTLALALMRLLPAEDYSMSGSVRLGGQELTALPEPEMRAIRGRRMALVLQDPSAALNPLLTVGRQIGEAVVEHGLGNWRAAQTAGLDTLAHLGFGDPRSLWDRRPGELSGGMKQRVCLAMAVVLAPDLLLLDEPTAHLDWETRQEVLEAIERAQTATKCAMLWFTHDEAVMERYAGDGVLDLRNLQAREAETCR